MNCIKKHMKKLLFALTLLLIPRIMFSKPPINFQESRPSIKYQNNTLDRDALSPFTGINAEGVVFDKEGFEDHYEDEFLDGDITEEEYNDLLAESEAFSQVTETISELVQSGEGHVDQNGNFIPNNPGTTSVASEDEITGIDMMIGGITEPDNTIAHIWDFWSDYRVDRSKIIK